MKILPGEAVLGTRLLRHWGWRERSDHFDPFKMKLFVTRRCNLACRHCGIGGAGFDASGELTTGQIAALWRANPGLQVISLSGGEPFLREDLEEIALAAIAGLPHLQALTVNTNGWHTDRIVRFARAVAPRMPSRSRLVIAGSSDGPAEVHGRIRGSAASFEHKETTLSALRDLAGSLPALRVRHNVNVNPWNLDVIADYVAAVRARGEACFVSLYAAAEHYGHGSEDTREATVFRRELARHPELLDRLGEGQDFLGDRFLCLADPFFAGSGRVQPLPCFALRASVIVEHDGTVRPCLHFPVDLGRVQDHGYDLGEIGRAPRANALRRQIRAGTCPVCWTPNEAYVTLMCNLFNPALWRPRA